MVNWQDPSVIAKQTEIFVRFVHILGGLHLCEFLLRFPYEWAIYTGKRPLTWSAMIYVASRWILFIDFALFLVILNVDRELNCSAAFKAVTVLANVSLGFSSSLLMLRAIAINGGKRAYTVSLVVVLFADWGTLLHGMSVADAIWVPAISSCSIINTSKFKLNVIVSFCSDLVFLIVSFVALLRKEGLSRLWRLLYREGLICMAVATIAYLLPAVFLILDLNDVMNYMFQPFALLVMVTCATRMYRELSEYLQPSRTATSSTTFITSSYDKPKRSILKGSLNGPVSVTIQMETTTETDVGYLSVAPSKTPNRIDDEHAADTEAIRQDA